MHISMNNIFQTNLVPISLQPFFNAKKRFFCTVRYNQQGCITGLLCNYYDKKMPISNKVNRYNINDYAIPETKKNNSYKQNKQAFSFEPFSKTDFQAGLSQNPKQLEKDLWEKFKQVQVQYLTRNYPLENNQLFEKFALSKFQQMTSKQVKNYISRIKKLPINELTKKQQTQDIDYFLGQIQEQHDQSPQIFPNKQKLKKKSNYKQKKKSYQGNFLFTQQIDENSVVSNNLMNYYNQQTALKQR